MKFVIQLVVSSVIAFVVFGALLFLPAGTFAYWQAWVFLAVLVVVSAAPTIYLAVANPGVLERRMRAGPTAETRTAQKFASAGTLLSFAAAMAISALDHRFSWSPVPTAVSLIGNVLVAIGVGITCLVLVQNSYAAANITVETDQKVVSTGLYGLVRHPMYVGILIIMIGIPLALDSYWGLLTLIPSLIAFAVRILDEERAREQELAGYREYTEQVNYRLVPYVW